MTARQHLPTRRDSTVFSFEHALAEIFIDHARPNSQIAELANAAAVLVSLLLQHGVTAAKIRHSISGPIATALDKVENRP